MKLIETFLRQNLKQIFCLPVLFLSKKHITSPGKTITPPRLTNVSTKGTCKDVKQLLVNWWHGRWALGARPEREKAYFTSTAETLALFKNQIIKGGCTSSKDV